MTYRLMAEWATDACQKQPAASPAHRQAEPAGSRDRKVSAPGLSVPAEGSAQYHHGERVIAFFPRQPKASALICEVRDGDRRRNRIRLRELDVDNLVDLRRRTRLGMGPVRGAVRPSRRRPDAGVRQGGRPSGLASCCASSWRSATRVPSPCSGAMPCAKPNLPTGFYEGCSALQ